MSDLTTRSAGLRAVAHLRPDPDEIEPFLNDQELAADQRRMATHVQAMSDLTADVLDILMIVWIQQAVHPGMSVEITADQFLQFRGLQKHKGGTGRRGGYKEAWRQVIARQMDILSDLWMTIDEMDTYQTVEGRKGPYHKRINTKRINTRRQGKAVLVTERTGVVAADGTLKPSRWRVRPGDVFATFLLRFGRQVALLSRKALEYDPYRQKWEKRLTRYFAWLWRNRQADGQYSDPVCVLTLLEFVVRQRLTAERTGLAGLYAGVPKRPAARPTTERLRKRFQGVTLTIIRKGWRQRSYLTPLSCVQRHNLAFLNFPVDIYTRLYADSHNPP